MKHIKSIDEASTSAETGEYPAPKFVVRPAAGDAGYDMVAKEFGAPMSPKKKKKKSNTQEVKEMSNIKSFEGLNEEETNTWNDVRNTIVDNAEEWEVGGIAMEDLDTLIGELDELYHAPKKK